VKVRASPLPILRKANHILEDQVKMKRKILTRRQVQEAMPHSYNLSRLILFSRLHSAKDEK